MRDDPLPKIAGTITAIFLACAFLLGSHSGKSNIKEQAIRASVAYYTNNASGEAQFKWKESK